MTYKITLHEEPEINGTTRFSIKIKDKEGVHLKKGELTKFEIDDCKFTPEASTATLLIAALSEKLLKHGVTLTNPVIEVTDKITIYVVSLTSDAILETNTVIGSLYILVNKNVNESTITEAK